jgi:hypothetical protein
MARNGWLSDVWASLGEIRVPVRYGFAKFNEVANTRLVAKVIRKFKYIL